MNQILRTSYEIYRLVFLHQAVVTNVLKDGYLHFIVVMTLLPHVVTYI